MGGEELGRWLRTKPRVRRNSSSGKRTLLGFLRWQVTTVGLKNIYRKGKEKEEE